MEKAAPLPFGERSLILHLPEKDFQSYLFAPGIRQELLYQNPPPPVALKMAALSSLQDLRADVLEHPGKAPQDVRLLASVLHLSLHVLKTGSSQKLKSILNDVGDALVKFFPPLQSSLTLNALDLSAAGNRLSRRHATGSLAQTRGDRPGRFSVG